MSKTPRPYKDQDYRESTLSPLELYEKRFPLVASTKDKYILLLREAIYKLYLRYNPQTQEEDTHPLVSTTTTTTNALVQGVSELVCTPSTVQDVPITQVKKSLPQPFWSTKEGLYELIRLGSLGGAILFNLVTILIKLAVLLG